MDTFKTAPPSDRVEALARLMKTLNNIKLSVQESIEKLKSIPVHDDDENDGTTTAEE